MRMEWRFGTGDVFNMASAASESVENNENLLRTLFRQSFPDAWKENQDFASYLAELSASSLDKLSREPERLAEEKAQVLEQTEHLAFHNYKTFIKTAECSKEIFKDFISVERHVESLLDKLPTFSKTCSNFMETAQDINSSRRLNSLTLQRHTQLLEILEISQLMDTCVRNGYYEEALELSSYVHRLEKKLSNIPVIQSIVEEVQCSTELMLCQLLQQLRCAIQLPACLRVIGYLRRLDVFTESELRIKFLQARDAWLQSVLCSIPSEDPYYHITKTIEASRVHLFDIVTQYRAIFSDDDPILSMEHEENPVYSNLFHCWTAQKVYQFLTTLEHDLDRGVGSRLDSLLGQCMYFGLSFSRVGADFRGLLPPLFQNAALQGVVKAVEDATRRFNVTMKSYSLLPLSVAVTYVVSTNSFKPGDESNQVSSPPVVLLQHPPLATYTNSILSALNELRHCAPLALFLPLANVLQASLDSVVATTCSFHRTEAAVLNEQERATFANFCQVLGRDLVPYINYCIEAIYPKSVLNTVLGTNSLDGLPSMPSNNRPLRLDVKKIVLPLEPVIPQDTKNNESKGDHGATAFELQLPTKDVVHNEKENQAQTLASDTNNQQTKQELQEELKS